MSRLLFQIARTLHAWGGITLALLMLLSSTTGTLLVWKQEFLWLTVSAARADFDPSPENLVRVIEAAEAQFDPSEILNVQLATRDFPLTKLTLVGGRYAYLDAEGGIVDDWILNERPEEWLYDLHHRLLLEDLGLTLVGLSAMAMSVLVLAGLVAFWPARQGLRRGFWPASTARPHLMGAHRNIGLFEALPFLLTLATGVVLAFPFQIEERFLYPVRHTDEYSDATQVQLDGISGGDSGEWLPAMRRALAVFDAGEVRSVQVANDYNNYRIFGIKQPGEWHPDGMSKVYIDAAGGYMDVRIDATTVSLTERAHNAVYPLHTGRIGNVFYKLFLTASGLLVATLSVLGIMSFIRKYRPVRQ